MPNIHRQRTLHITKLLYVSCHLVASVSNALDTAPPGGPPSPDPAALSRLQGPTLINENSRTVSGERKHNLARTAQNTNVLQARRTRSVYQPRREQILEFISAEGPSRN
ncbi:unnamed protein product [Hermetia illucens]|uniref:Secreted protein n=1 Tax=Hermetia illucens TaxID=343691 RepID=A0A7R8YXP9_HERIL|nr:unnamed protein product [Hermetia illucens]